MPPTVVAIVGLTPDSVAERVVAGMESGSLSITTVETGLVYQAGPVPGFAARSAPPDRAHSRHDAS